MHSVRWSEYAAEDVVQIVAHIAQENPIAAARYGEDIVQVVELLKFMPEISRVWEVDERFRCCTLVKPYLIIYRIDVKEKFIHIVRIIHAKRNPYDMGW